MLPEEVISGLLGGFLDTSDIEPYMRTIIDALEKQIPKKPRETRCALMCSRCGHKITEKDGNIKEIMVNG